MKKSLFMAAALLLSLCMFTFSACDDDEEEKTVGKPVVALNEVGKENSKTAIAGSDLHLEGEITAENGIKRIDIEIHQEEGGEFRIEKSFTEGKYIGVKNTTFHEHIDIPAEAPAGAYHLHFTVTDKLHRPIMIHRAPFGSMERFVAVLLEHTGGKFPLWLSPQQVVVLPISEKFNDYAQKVAEYLNRNDVRTEVDDRNEKIGRKIRDNELKRVPYLLIVGEKEEAEGLVSVRAQGEGDKGQMTMEAFRDLIAGLVKEEIDANKLEKK